MPSKRDELRQKALGGQRSAPILVEHDGATYELRRPSIKLRGQITEAATTMEMDADGKPKPKVNSALMQVLAVMRLTYVPGTDERLFEQADQDSLMNEESGGLVDVLGKAAVKLLSPDIGALGKSSAQIPSTSSATE